MAALQNVGTIQFRVETLAFDPKKRNALKKDKNGYFLDVPIAVLGVVSQNYTYYDVTSFMQQMTDPKTYINKVLTQGKLYGEYGHPKIIGLPLDQALERLSVVDEKSRSHHFSSISTGTTLSDGGKLVIANIKPAGPYAKALQDELEDPCMNTSFSLRAITSAEQRGQVSYRVMKKLVTFDAVTAGGYAEAAKSYSPSLESFDVEILPESGQVQLTQISLEHYTDTELNDIFGIKAFTKEKKIVSLLDPIQSDQFKSSVGNKSFYMDFVRE